jgi:hypothetical protein
MITHNNLCAVETLRGNFDSIEHFKPLEVEKFPAPLSDAVSHTHTPSEPVGISEAPTGAVPTEERLRGSMSICTTNYHD